MIESYADVAKGPSDYFKIGRLSQIILANSIWSHGPLKVEEGSEESERNVVAEEAREN